MVGFGATGVTISLALGRTALQAGLNEASKATAAASNELACFT